MSGEDETPMSEERYEKMTPNDRLEYHIHHMADPEYRKWMLARIDRSTPFGEMLYKTESQAKVYRLQKRPPTSAKPLKTFDHTTIYKVISSLQTPASFTAPKNEKDRLDRSITAPSLRQYVDSLLTWGYITLADLKIKKKEYPHNFVPRSDFTAIYKQITRGKRYVRLYRKVLEMASEIETKGHMDRL